jgi:hypothetical protein
MAREEGRKRHRTAQPASASGARSAISGSGSITASARPGACDSTWLAKIRASEALACSQGASEPAAAIAWRARNQPPMTSPASY